MLIDVIDVKVQDDFWLFLRFENGELKKFDCKTLFDKKPFQALKNKCKALTSVQPCASQFWSLDHEN